MKKFLITISPLCVILFIIMWILCGLTDAFAFFGAMLLTFAFMFWFAKWMYFVDKHIKD